MKKSAWTFILAAAMLLAGCGSPEKPPIPAEELLERLPATPDMAVSSDEKVLPELMKSAAAATAARYMDSGYRIVKSRPDLPKNCWNGCQPRRIWLYPAMKKSCLS